MRYWHLPKGSCKRHDFTQHDDANSYSCINEITRPQLFRPELINVLAHPRIDETMHALLDSRGFGALSLLWASQKSL